MGSRPWYGSGARSIPLEESTISVIAASKFVAVPGHFGKC